MGKIIGVSGDGSSLAGAADAVAGAIPNAMEQAARMRAATMFRECARLAESMPWMEGSLKKWMLDDELEQCVQTNQGVFRVIIRRG